MTAILIGTLFVVLLGVMHSIGMIAIRKLPPRSNEGSQAAILASFCGLLVLHMLEIAAFAVAYRHLLSVGWMGGFGDRFDGSWESLLYFSGMNFVTLGYAQLQAHGPIRLVSMMQSLGGFMVLTWSATFIYSVSQSAWSRSDR